MSNRRAPGLRLTGNQSGAIVDSCRGADRFTAELTLDYPSGEGLRARLHLNGNIHRPGDVIIND